MTNRERLAAMSDMELAAELLFWDCADACGKLSGRCPYSPACVEKIAGWLKKEVR